jgi:GT2 family glycosyltransferase
MDEQAPASAPETVRGARPGGPDATGARALETLRLLVAIVNFRTSELVIDGLAALEPELAGLPRAHVVVVDNASGDGSVERLRAAIDERGWSGWCTLVASATNGGFSYGNNEAIRSAPTPRDYVLLLNPDTRIRPGAVRTLLAFMEERPDVGVAGSRLEDEDGTQQHSRYRFPSVLGELESTVRLGLVTRLASKRVVAPPLVTEAHACDWVAGASLILRREVLDAVGPLDERYFLYYEEVDFCRRVRDAGSACWYVPDARVVHHVGKSSGVTSREALRTRRPRYWFESRRRYFVEHHGRAYTLLADLAWIVGQSLWRLRVLVQRKHDPDPPHLLRDFLRFNVFSLDGWRRPRGDAGGGTEARR